ncbi:MAG: DUF2293 domain-containing protein [Oligosphaeraceae bacterium]
MSGTAPEPILVWETEAGQHSVFSRNGRRVTLPDGWVFVPSGDPGLTRRLKAAGPCWQVVHNRRGRQEGIGLCVPQATLERERRKLEDERAAPAYERRLEAGRRARAAKQTRYEADFLSAVRSFLAFAPRWRELGERLAAAVTAHAVPVGSGTVARTERIPLERRAEAAVIAWMRHQTTAYDHLTIARVKGARREVRRQLAARSRELLQRYRDGQDVDQETCPLATALRRLDDAPVPAPARPAVPLRSTLADGTPDLFADAPLPKGAKPRPTMNRHLSDFFADED